jgi:hypothetical protein
MPRKTADPLYPLIFCEVFREIRVTCDDPADGSQFFDFKVYLTGKVGFMVDATYAATDTLFIQRVLQYCSMHDAIESAWAAAERYAADLIGQDGFTLAYRRAQDPAGTAMMRASAGTTVVTAHVGRFG